MDQTFSKLTTGYNGCCGKLYVFIYFNIQKNNINASTVIKKVWC